jgi:hypothetical protein
MASLKCERSAVRRVVLHRFSVAATVEGDNNISSEAVGSAEGRGRILDAVENVAEMHEPSAM